MIYNRWIRSNTPKISNCFGNTHWSKFEDVRAKHNENVCLETNKLVLRLDKLINPEDGQNQDLDKSIVEWASDKLVNLCPYCAKTFTFARRRHHCRACGAILCNNCSRFLEYKDACRLVNPVKLFMDPYDRIDDKLQSRTVESLPAIRTCEDCLRLLEKRKQSIEDYYCQPKLEESYEKLRQSMSEADDMILSHSSLVSERKEPTPDLRAKIQDLKQSVALMGSKFSKMAERESGKQAFLMKSISQSVSSWLKEGIELKMNRVYGSRIERSAGWVPEQPTPASDISIEEDPILIQIRNLEEYIRQAKAANRYEEVSALEANRRDLEIEYLLQKDLNIRQDSSEEAPGTSDDI